MRVRFYQKVGDTGSIITDPRVAEKPHSDKTEPKEVHEFDGTYL